MTRRSSHIEGRNPWDKRPGETIKAYRAFQSYLKKEGGYNGRRSVVELAHDFKCTRQNLNRWMADHEWRARAEAYDLRMSQVEQERREKVAAEYAEKMERRRKEAADMSWELSLELATKARDMLKVGLFEEEADEDGLKIRKVPAKWTMDTAAKMAKAASDLAQVAVLAMGLVSEDGFDPLNASPEELREYLLKKGVKAPGAGPPGGQ